MFTKVDVTRCEDAVNISLTKLPNKERILIYLPTHHRNKKLPTLTHTDNDGQLVKERTLTPYEWSLVSGYVQMLNRTNLSSVATTTTKEPYDATAMYCRFPTPMPDEPTFTLLGRDPQAPALVQQWAWDRAKMEPNSPRAGEALIIMTMMLDFKDRNPDLGAPCALYYDEVVNAGHKEAERLITNADDLQLETNYRKFHNELTLRMRAKALIAEAKAVGCVVTISTAPLEPLAMGHYEIVIDVREHDYHPDRKPL